MSFFSNIFYFFSAVLRNQLDYANKDVRDTRIVATDVASVLYKHLTHMDCKVCWGTLHSNIQTYNK